MAHKGVDSRHPIDTCTLQLHSWRPFHIQTLDSPKPSPTIKRPCLSDRSTSLSSPIDAIDFSKLSLIDDYIPAPSPTNNNIRGAATGLRLIARKRRRRGSRSVSGRSSDRSGTRRCSVGASAAYGTCSDFPVAVGTDSSGELFGNGGDANWASDVSEARNSSRRDKDHDKESFCGVGFGVQLDHGQGNESGYGSEPGYRGDAEFGYGDEFDEEEDDSRLLFWGDHFGTPDSKMEVVGENTFSEQKAHYRCRRKKHDCRMVDSLR
ncbi:LOW QUALITY PROTEIN: hypothetical protein CFOL_v3_10455, partial [Cephalotus follicularis]